MSSAFTPTRTRITTNRYQMMVARGVLTKYDRIELIEGDMLDMAPIGLKHARRRGDGCAPGVARHQHYRRRIIRLRLSAFHRFEFMAALEVTDVLFHPDSCLFAAPQLDGVGDFVLRRLNACPRLRYPVDHAGEGGGEQ